MSARLSGKVAVITGGSAGIGLATAKLFVHEGIEHVFITGRHQDMLDDAVSQIGRNVTAVQGDVAKTSDLDSLYATIKASNRHIDIVFANAGIVKTSDFGIVDEGLFDWHFDTNVKGVFFTVQKALPFMPNGASIVLNGSIAAQKGLSALSVYSATKAAVRSLARSWANDLRSRRIRVNVVSPGHIDTAILEDLRQGEELNRMKQEYADHIPLGRLGTPEEVAHAVSFLASDDASYISGVELHVDGGLAQI